MRFPHLVAESPTNFSGSYRVIPSHTLPNHHKLQLSSGHHPIIPHSAHNKQQPTAGGSRLPPGPSMVCSKPQGLRGKRRHLPRPERKLKAAAEEVLTALPVGRTAATGLLFTTKGHLTARWEDDAKFPEVFPEVRRRRCGYGW